MNKAQIRYNLFLFLAFLSFLSGCKPGCPCTFNLPTLCHCPPGRKPPVAVYKAPEIKEYSFEDCKFDDTTEEPYYKDCCDVPGPVKGKKTSCKEPYSPCQTPCFPYDDPCATECIPDECEEKVCQKECQKPCSSEDDLEDLIDRNQPLMKEYFISVGDVLEISVFGDEDTHVDNVIVAPDGRIYYLFLNGIQAEGKTTDALQKDMEAALSSMFLSPSVSIIPRLMSKNTFTILGRVRRPGSYPLTQTVTIRQALGMAGGLMLEPEVMTSFEQTTRLFIQSSRSRIYIQPYQGLNQNISSLRDSFLIRDGKKLNINFEHLVYSGDPSQDIVLRPGDYLYIASDDRREVYVLGNVNNPTAITFQDNLTLMKALAMVGGWRMGGPYAADMQNVLIIRGSLQCPQVVRVDLCEFIRGEARDIFLQPGDIVYIHNKKFRFGRELVRLAVNAFIFSFVNQAGEFFANEHIN